MSKVAKDNSRNTPPQQLANELNKVKRINQALVVGFSGLLIIMVGVIAITSTQSVEGSPSPGTCLPLDKGGTGCDREEFRDEFSLLYSTDEQLTGRTWIDGKPIYEKTFTGSFTITNTATVVKVLQGNISTLIKQYGTVGFGNNQWHTPLNSSYAATTAVRLVAASNNAELVAFSTGYPNQLTNYYIVLEYTKI